MNAQEVLIRQVQEHTKHFIAAARALPADKLEFRAGQGNRTPLDILQEVATIARGVDEIIRDRKMRMDPEVFAQQQAQRAKLTDIEEIVPALEATTAEIVKAIEGTDPAVFADAVEMPWPGDFRVVDILTYHAWNLMYHEGQLVYILMAMGEPTPYDGM